MINRLELESLTLAQLQELGAFYAFELTDPNDQATWITVLSEFGYQAIAEFERGIGRKFALRGKYSFIENWFIRFANLSPYQAALIIASANDRWFEEPELRKKQKYIYRLWCIDRKLDALLAELDAVLEGSDD
jgi:hypothetical protein